MAQTGYTPIQLYRSTTASAVPSASDLNPGELAININDADMALYAENASGAVKRIMNNPAGLKYPTADGTSGQVMTTDGAGNVTFGSTTAQADAVKVTTSSTSSAFKVPFANTTASTTGYYGLLQDDAATFTYNPSTNTVTAGTFVGALTGNASTAISASTATTLTGLTATITELNYSSGVTSAIQTQLNAKVDETSSTGSAAIPAGTQAQRDGSPAAGYFRFNSDIAKFEGYNGTSWGSVGGGATGGGSDEIFIENGQTVTTNYSIPSSKNAMSTGPITINSGVTVTVPSGSNWVVL
jgi:hypothetical protein